jgi:fructose-1,6-bisphosphatase/inositol monophosphatase family enzyme
MSTRTDQQIDPRTFVERMSVPVLQAMAAVRWLEGRVKNRPKVSELTPEKAALTDGDCVSQEILLVALREAFPWVRLDVEEDTPTAADFAANHTDERVVIDPIDGTLRYLLADGPYAILVGLEQAERVEAALVGIPQTQTLVRAVRGQGAEISYAGHRFTPATVQHGGSEILVSYGLPVQVEHRLRACGFELTLAAGAVIGVAPLLPDVGGAIRITAHATGLSRRAWVAALPTLEAGGRLETFRGPFPERYERGITGILVGASEDAVSRLRGSLG